MSIFTVPTGNKEFPENYQNFSFDIAAFMQSLMKSSLKLYIKELLECTEGIDKVYNDLEDWQKVEFKSVLLKLLKLTEK